MGLVFKTCGSETVLKKFEEAFSLAEDTYVTLSPTVRMRRLLESVRTLFKLL